jgi:transcriptional regulator with XRE-family HTH domain
MSKEFGYKIKKARLARDLSLRALAELAEVDYSYISRLEKGNHTPSRETVTKIAKALKIPEDDLMIAAGYTPNPSKPISARESNADYSPVGFLSRGDINVKELEKIINRAVKKALAEREKERRGNGDNS